MSNDPIFLFNHFFNLIQKYRIKMTGPHLYLGVSIEKLENYIDAL